MSLEEGLNLITDLFGNNYRDNPDAFRIYRELRVQIRNQMNFTVFTHLVKVNPMLLSHPKDFIKSLRTHILSMDFWIRAGKRRTEAYGNRLYISPEMIFEKSNAKRGDRPGMPEEILKLRQKEKRKVEDGEVVKEIFQKGLEWGSPEWKEMRMTKNNPQFQ